MKRITLFLIGLLMLASATQAQSTTFSQDLDQVILAARDVRNDARYTRDILRSLALDYFQFNNPNPNVSGYLAVMNARMVTIDAATDVIVAKANSALLKNPGIDISDLVQWAADIDARIALVQTQSQNLANAIAQNNRPAAHTANNATRTYLSEQMSIASDIIYSAQQQKLVAQYYNVRISLVNANGSPVGSNGLQGYYAIDATGAYLYPTSQDGLVFEALPGGTYTFRAINGYFDGAGANTVILAPSMINSNGEVIVELIYWSE